MTSSLLNFHVVYKVTLYRFSLFCLNFEVVAFGVTLHWV